MKISIICILCFILIPLQSLMSQEIFPRDENGNIIYTDVISIDSVNSKDLYNRAHTWFANNFNSAKSVIQLEDKEVGKIIGKGYFVAGIEKSSAGVFKTPIMVSVHFTVDIQTKDGRYKYLFTDFTCMRFENTQNETICDLSSSSFTKNTVWQKALDKDWIEVKKDVNAKMITIIEGLKKALIIKNDNW